MEELSRRRHAGPADGIPGVDPESVLDITVEDGLLVIRAHREIEGERKSKRGVRSERRDRLLTRTVRLPEGVAGDDVKAI